MRGASGALEKVITELEMVAHLELLGGVAAPC
jgi:hypothetical protein